MSGSHEESDFYDSRWAHAELSHAKQLRGRAISRVIEQERRADLRILELGCGTGWLSNELSSFGTCHGVDISSLAIEQASRRYARPTFSVADLANFTPAERYNVVVSHEVLEHVRDQERHVRLAFDALVEGGVFVLTTPNAYAAFGALAEIRHQYDPQPIEHWLFRDEVDALVREAGFVVEQLTTIIPSRRYRSRLLRAITSDRLDRATDKLRSRDLWDKVKGRLGLNEAIFVVARRPRKAKTE